MGWRFCHLQPIAENRKVLTQRYYSFLYEKNPNQIILLGYCLTHAGEGQQELLLRGTQGGRAPAPAAGSGQPSMPTPSLTQDRNACEETENSHIHQSFCHFPSAGHGSHQAAPDEATEIGMTPEE